MKNKPKSHSSSGSLIEPYQLGFTPGNAKDLSEKQNFGNHCFEVFQRIAAKRKAIKDNGGKTTGLCEIIEI